ncbi:hypothetical protein ES705_06371 [subsurface metagenome]
MNTISEKALIKIFRKLPDSITLPVIKLLEKLSTELAKKSNNKMKRFKSAMGAWSNIDVVPAYKKLKKEWRHWKLSV